MSRQDRHAHDRALELAAGAIDYRLTPDQATVLDAHLATCPACARSAAAMRGDAIALRPRTRPLPSRRVDDAVAAAIAGRRAAAPSLLVLVAAALLLVALLGVAAAAGSLLLRSWSLQPPVDGRFGAVFVRPTAGGDVTAASMIVAVGADGTERVITTVPNVATTAMTFRMALSEAGHLALTVRDGESVGWAVLDITDPKAKPIPVALAGRDDYNPGFAIWGPGDRLAIVLSPSSDRQAIAFVDPASGAAAVHPFAFDQYAISADRGGVWAADGSGVVLRLIGPPSSLAILSPDGHVAPLSSRVWPDDIGHRDVNTDGGRLLGGIDPVDQPNPGSSRLSVQLAGGQEQLLVAVGGDEVSDRAWAADGRGVWFFTAEWRAANRPVTLERFSPPSTRIAIASFVAALDVPAKDTYAPAASFAGIAPDDSLAVVAVATTSSDPVVFQGKLVDLRSGSSMDVDGSFVGWLAAQE